jgi:hypothetical protein
MPSNRAVWSGGGPTPRDRRATLVEVTEHGVSVLAAIRAAGGTEAERVFGRLSGLHWADLSRYAAVSRFLPPVSRPAAGRAKITGL